VRDHEKIKLTTSITAIFIAACVLISFQQGVSAQSQAECKQYAKSVTVSALGGAARGAISGAALGGLFIATPALAQDDATPTTGSVDMATMVCRDLMVEDDIGKAAVLGYLIGYASGITGDTVLSDETVENQSLGVVDYCLDNPTANLFKAFEAQD
jgi:hypothetical protein